MVFESNLGVRQELRLRLRTSRHPQHWILLHIQPQQSDYTMPISSQAPPGLISYPTLTGRGGEHSESTESTKHPTSERDSWSFATLL